MNDHVGGRGDGGHGQDAPREVRAGAQRRGASDLPEDVALLRAVDQVHDAVGRGDERRVGLEDEDRVPVVRAVERERSGDLQRELAGPGVHACQQGGTTELGVHRPVGRPARRRSPCAASRSTWACCVGIVGLVGSGRIHHTRRKARDRCPRREPEAGIEDARAGICHRRRTQNRVVGRSAHRHSQNQRRARARSP